MGLLVNGQWQDKWYDTDNNQGEFKREAAQLRNWVTEDGSAGQSGDAGFKAEKDRYHLYVSLACPWAHRTLIFRHLKGLEDYISVSVVSPDMLEHGWTFDKDNHSTGDALFDSEFMHQIYTRNKADYSGRVTVPVLWDKKTQRIVSNESAEIIRMFNSAFNALTGNERDFYPQSLRSEIDEVNEFVYHNINNGVYRAGFATTQEAYTEAFDDLFAALDKIEQRLTANRYLVGETLTEADWRLFTTLIRFDSVYVGHFKCNLRTIESYPAISNYLRELYQIEGVSKTVDFYHIKRHYYFSHTMINPTQVVPKGPDIDYARPHNRG
ncbi:glutathione S-transferase family protein [Pseudoalteromonas shioyasakiensis]|uniref:Glutathione S-transferase family protein n=2 Tax=Pseudoalteromonas TaxID=53246 RepID=A0ABT6TYM0_9GAMM|nr:MULTISPECIES: glutathione S-transferase family protein [Pseudoalteromonas]MCO7207888.1 glutathione S-transferase family protein [Pseudoalteromonas sp. CnMc7-37]NUJ31124.1 glutathione S-transferase family protein [Pseudoalteromonas sp. 2103]MCO6355533.1 glutathione S-transferase family protein [Pseudoalteromonas shioyasakiensis]MDI4669017.1 glutathione S-transferase family protein [Pseudoalteromonas shioyasakiensis]MDI4686287.1 glutathione S-transferase family protein [Pseudoalteromonas shio